MIRGQSAPSPLPVGAPFCHSGMRRLRLKNRYIVKIIWALSLRAFNVDTFIKRDAQSGCARIRSWHLLFLIRIVPIVREAQ